MRVGGADVPSSVSVSDGGCLFGPLPCQRLDRPGRYPTDLCRPFRRLGNPVFLAHYIFLEFFEAVRVGLHVLLVVGTLGDPCVGDGKLHGRVCIRPDRDPFVRVDGSPVVQIGADVDLFHTYLGPEIAEAARLLSRPAPGRCLGIAPPEEQHIGVFGDIFPQVRLYPLPYRVLTPYVLRPPVPPFPAVRVSRLQRVAAHEIEQVRMGAMDPVNRLGFPVSVGLREDRGRPVFLLDAPQLVGHYLCGLVPRYPYEFALPPVLGITLAVRVKIDALERVEYPVWRIRPFLVGKAEGRDQGLHGRLERFAACLDLPGLHLFRLIFFVEVKRAHSHDPSVLHVHA